MNSAASLRAARGRVTQLNYRSKLIAGVTIASLGVLGSGALAFALWNAQDSVSGGEVVAGDLDLAYGTGTWSQITPGVAAPAGGTLLAGTDGFHSMPGDVIEFSIPVTTTLQGNNLSAEMKVAMESSAAQYLENGVIEANYFVQDARGDAASETAELGSSVQVEGLIGGNEAVVSDWTIVVTVAVLGEYVWTAAEPLAELGAWDIDGIDVSLHQTRSGEGFVTSENGS